MRGSEGSGRRGRFAFGVALTYGLMCLTCDSMLGVYDYRFARCDPGKRQCAGNTPQVCDDNGMWSSELSCSALAEGTGGDGGDGAHQTCVAGACEGECTADELRCAGDTPQKCGPDGYWRDEPPCVSGGCRGGKCGEVCTDGDSRCSTDGSNSQERCERGQWQVEPCPPCHTCDSRIGACPTAWADAPGTPCDDPKDRCILRAECGEDGRCNPTNRVMCAPPGPDVCAAEACDPETGTCAAEDDKICDDGDVCTNPDSCKAGACNLDGDDDHLARARWNFARVPSPRFVPKGEFVVFDAWTGLAWERATERASHDWDSAQDRCKELHLGGYQAGWRLPTRVELLSIVDYEAQAPPTIDRLAFSDATNEKFWSSSHTALEDYRWGVNFDDGSVRRELKSERMLVRCVRSGGLRGGG